MSNPQVLVGPSRALKGPNDIPANAKNTDYHLDPGTYPAIVRTVNWVNVSLQPVDPSDPVTLINDGSKEYGLFQLQGTGSSAAISDLHFQFGSTKGVVAQTRDNANLTLTNLVQNQGCLFWGSGGGNVNLNGNVSNGQPHDYYICNFDSDIALISIQNNNALVQQGPNQAAIRIMDCLSFYAKGLKFKPFLISGAPYKQEIQLRSGPSKGGGKFCLEDCVIGLAALGYMEGTFPLPKYPISLIQFIGGSLTDYVIGPQIFKVQFSNTLVRGKMTNNTPTK